MFEHAINLWKNIDLKYQSINEHVLQKGLT